MAIILNNAELKITKYLLRVFLTLSFFGALLHVLNFPHDLANYAWQFMAFSFVAGSFVLSIKPEYLKNDQKKFIPQVSFSMIFSSILLFISFALSLSENSQTFISKFIPFLSAGILFLAIFLFSFALSELTIELGKNIFPKK